MEAGGRANLKGMHDQGQLVQFVQCDSTCLNQTVMVKTVLHEDDTGISRIARGHN